MRSIFFLFVFLFTSSTFCIAQQQQLPKTDFIVLPDSDADQATQALVENLLNSPLPPVQVIGTKISDLVARVDTQVVVEGSSKKSTSLWRTALFKIGSLVIAPVSCVAGAAATGVIGVFDTVPLTAWIPNSFVLVKRTDVSGPDQANLVSDAFWGAGAFILLDGSKDFVGDHDGGSVHDDIRVGYIGTRLTAQGLLGSRSWCGRAINTLK